MNEKLISKIIISLKFWTFKKLITFIMISFKNIDVIFEILFLAHEKILINVAWRDIIISDDKDENEDLNIND